MRSRTILGRLVDAAPAGRIWILLDEWAAVPMDLQPLLADLLTRRAVFHRARHGREDRGHRAALEVPSKRGDGDYLGIEVGAGTPLLNLDLDDFMVFGNDADAGEGLLR